MHSDSITDHDVDDDDVIDNKRRRLEILVKSNYNDVRVRMADDEAKASSLIEKIQKRADDVKKAVDSMAAEWIETVEKKLKYHLSGGAGVLEKLKNIEVTLITELKEVPIEGEMLKPEGSKEEPGKIKTDEDKDFENIFGSTTKDAEITASEIDVRDFSSEKILDASEKETECHNFDDTEAINMEVDRKLEYSFFDSLPNHSGRFDLSLNISKSALKVDLKKIMGSLKTEISLGPFKEHQLDLSVQSIAADQFHVYVAHRHDSVINQFDSEGLVFEKSHDLRKQLTTVSDMIVIDNILFVVGRFIRDDNIDATEKCQSNNGRPIDRLKILKLGKTVSNVRTMPHWDGGVMYKLAKSHRGNVIVTTNRSLLYVSEFHTFDVEFGVTIVEAIQMDKRFYALCCCLEKDEDNIVCIFDNHRRMVARYAPSDDLSSSQMIEPCCLARDRRGFLYVGDYRKKMIFILDGMLSFVASFPVSGYLFKLIYVEENDSLMGLTRDRKLLLWNL